MNIEKHGSSETDPAVRRELANKIQARAAELGKSEEFTDAMLRTTVEVLTKRFEELGEPLTEEEVGSDWMMALIDKSLDLRLEGKTAQEAVNQLQITPDLRVEHKN